MMTDEIEALYEAIKEQAARAEYCENSDNPAGALLAYTRFNAFYAQVIDAKLDEIYAAIGEPVVAMTRGRMAQ
jgi:cytochrome b